MKILFLTHRLPYAPNRGDRIRAYHLVHELARTADVHLVSLVHDEDEYSHRHDLDHVTASTDVVRVRRVRRLLPAAIALAGDRPLTHALLHSPAIYGVLRRRIDASSPDVVLAYCSGMARYACEPILSRLPFVLDLVDVDSEKWLSLGQEARWPKGWIFRRESALLRRFEIEATTRAAATTVVSDRELALLGEIGAGGAATVVPNGIDVESFRPSGPPAEEARVVFCGVFSYEPNERAAVWFARSVWPAVVRVKPDARLTLVGMSPSRAVLALAADPTIEVTGAVPDVRPYLWRSAVSVAPLEVARGVQNKVLEALAAGLPTVVTSPVAEGLPAQVRSACMTADAPEAFAKAVLELLAMPAAERRRLTTLADLGALSWRRQLAPMVDLIRTATAARF